MSVLRRGRKNTSAPIDMRCKAHETFTAKMKPRVGCVTCWRIYAAYNPIAIKSFIENVQYRKVHFK